MDSYSGTPTQAEEAWVAPGLVSAMVKMESYCDNSLKRKESWMRTRQAEGRHNRSPGRKSWVGCGKASPGRTAHGPRWHLAPCRQCNVPSLKGFRCVTTFTQRGACPEPATILRNVSDDRN